MSLDFFDASINRVSAWVVGIRSWQKCMLNALLMPHAQLKELQDSAQFSKLMAIQEELKTLPFGDIWNEYCKSCGVPSDIAWFDEVEKYEAEVLSKRV
jgi:L-rhamnose isomerase